MSSWSEGLPNWLKWVIVIAALTALTVAWQQVMVRSVVQAAPNCRQYLDKAIEKASAADTTRRLDVASTGAAEALAWAKIAEVCTKF